MLEEIRNKIVKEIVYNLDNRGLFKGIDDEIKEEIVLELEETVSSIKEILKHYIPISEVEEIVRSFVEFVASFHGKLDAGDLVDAFMKQYKTNKEEVENE